MPKYETCIKSAIIRPDQDKWITDNKINFSDLVREAIDREMEKVE